MTNSPPTSTSTATPTRRYRYSRSSTASVTQLLSDSCNSLLQRFRRNPSEKPEKKANATSNSRYKQKKLSKWNGRNIVIIYIANI